MAIDNKAEFFLNFQQFGDIKRLAREQSSDAANTVARQFEGLFVQQMLSAMRSASKIDSDQHSSYMDTYLDMYDKQLAQTIAGQDRLGVAKLILQQIPTDDTAAATTATAVAAKPLDLPAVPVPAPATLVPASADREPSLSPDTPSSSVIASKVIDDDFAEVAQIERANNRWQEPGQFVADIWPQAQSAAQTLGVSPQLLVAQSALETGWGKHTMKFDDGRSSYNLFGIKAGADWHGNSLPRASLEFSEGVLKSQLSSFRAYASPAQSLDDYVDFIQSNPRYQQALAQAGDDRAYIREIQNAGYATDPQYADKIIGILNGELLQNSLAALSTGVTRHA